MIKNEFLLILEYILLENVTAKFTNPCILDLKMGKRQYADIDSDKKRQSKIQKCEQSTSSKLGVRLCGMQVNEKNLVGEYLCTRISLLTTQVYQIKSDGYIFIDKYRGRVLNIEEFRSSLVQFFDNGREKRFDVIPKILERLESLLVVLSSLLKYRFYSGSLLIVYDGAPHSNCIDVRMIDFASTIRGNNEDAAANNHPGPDKGYLCGLERIIGFLKDMFNDQERKDE